MKRSFSSYGSASRSRCRLRRNNIADLSLWHNPGRAWIQEVNSPASSFKAD